MCRLIVRILLVGATTVLNACGHAESRFFYFPSREPFTSPAGVEDVWIPRGGPDGPRLHAWLVRPRRWREGDPPFPAVLHVHGNAGNISGHFGFSEFLPAAGFGVLIFDYRGYGRSDVAGRGLRRADLLEDAGAAFDWLEARPEVDPQRIAVYGVSLGGVIGAALAAERPQVRAVVLVSAFSSWRAIAGEHGGWVGRLLIRPGLDAEESVKRLGPRPLLIVHGDRDDIVPVSHGRALARAAAAAGVPVTFQELRGAGHNDLAEDPRLAQVLAEFLRGAMPGASREPDRGGDAPARP